LSYDISFINDGDKLIRYLSTQLLGASKLGSRVLTLEISTPMV